MNKIAVGDVILYPTIQQITGHHQDTRKGRGIISSARKILLNQHEKVFECVFKVGYSLLGNKEVVGCSAHDAQRIGNTCKRAITKLKTVEADKLDQTERAVLSARMSQYSIIALAAKSDKAAVAIAQNVGIAKGDAKGSFLASIMDAAKEA